MNTLPLRRRFFAISICAFATATPILQAQTNNPVTVIELTLDQPVLRGEQVGSASNP